jgi:hypothetical protein
VLERCYLLSLFDVDWTPEGKERRYLADDALALLRVKLRIHGER